MPKLKDTIEYSKIICELLACPSVEIASENLGISKKVIHRLFSDRAFVDQFTDAQQNLLARSTGYLSSNITKSISTILKMIDDKNTTDQIRLNACKTILEYSIKFTELSTIVPRIRKLEEELGIQ